MSPDPYDVLGVAREAQTEDLKAAYRRLVRENHPDVAFDKVAATARMADINQAWQLIGDPQKRLAFDARHRLDGFERQPRDQARRQQPPRQPNASSSASNAGPLTEKSRLEAQRRARLEREHLERERARRVRTSGAKPPSKPSSKTAPPAPNAARGTAAPRNSNAAPSGATKGSKGTERHATASRELRLRYKITQAAQLFHRERKVDEALALCRAVLQIDARSVPARELLGDIYLQQGRVEYALMMFDQALHLAPDNLMLRRKRDQLQNAQSKPKKPAPTPSSAAIPAKATRTSLLGRLRARLLRQNRQ